MPGRAHDTGERFRRRGRRRIPVRWRRRLGVFAGGVAGTAARYGVEAVVAGQGSWPWATFAVNISGALILGFVITRMLHAGTSQMLGVTLVAIGVLGAYTTFGAFAVETWQLGADGQWRAAIGYPLVTITGGLAATLLGIRLAERRT